MTRRIKREIRCRCGARFEATLYTSVNLKLDPDLKGEFLDGKLNLVTCPQCGWQQRIEVPLLYHDMERRIAIWVYPAAMKERATEIKKEMETVIKASLSGFLPEHGGSPAVGEMITEYLDYVANPHLVFGLDELAQLVAQLEEKDH